ncbi:MAG: sulfotransferase [Wenzhouxiangellaceae bacterium]|nr:sulfotransferase [Wenzhouxiangellaceae bacterium]
MPRLFLISLVRAFKLWLSAFASPVREGRRVTGALLVVVAWPLFVLLQCLHWLGFVVDELLFRGWRRVEVREPLFVLGPPRSGTTHLHRVLALDDRTTTFRLWECLFGLSVTGRKIALGLAAADRAVGRPFARLGTWAGGRLLGGMDEVHPLAMDAPEEDFLALMPPLECFILVVVFPRAEWLWRTARLDREGDAAHRRRMMSYYRDAVRRHLYVFGEERRFLSKNASFSGMTEALLETFPGARVVACMRDPVQTVPSQLSSIEPGLRAVGFDGVDPMLRDRFCALLKHYYLHLLDVAAKRPGEVVLVDNDALRDRLSETVAHALNALGLPLSPRFQARLDEADRASRGFRSGHEYSLSDYGIEEQSLRAEFAEVYGRIRFGDGSRVAAR